MNLRSGASRNEGNTGAARHRQAAVGAFAFAHLRYATGESPPGLTEDMRIRLYYTNMYLKMMLFT